VGVGIKPKNGAQAEGRAEARILKLRAYHYDFFFKILVNFY